MNSRFMALALKEARKGLGRTAPNPAVGAVIVKNGKVIATGHHKKAGAPHAEIEAFRKGAGREENWRGAALYVTLEPCCPPKAGGRTPPCTEAILRSGIKEVVIGMRDPDPRVSGRGIRRLRARGIHVREGVLQKACRDFYAPYLKHRRKKLPFVTVKMAVTLDGMAGRKNKRVWVTGPKARRLGHELRDRVDAILVGSGTIRSDNPRLTTRLPGRKGHDPIRIVLDSRLALFRSLLKGTWVATTLAANHPRCRRLYRRGIETILCRRDSKGRVEARSLLRLLAKRGIVHLLVEGGSHVWKTFLPFADRVVIHMAPDIWGTGGLPALGSSSDFAAVLSSLQRVQVTPVGRDLIIEGDPPDVGV